MNLETRWSGPALRSLSEVLHYTLEEHGEGQYNKIRRQVMEAVQNISQSPFSASIDPLSDKLGFELRSYKVISRIKIMYSIIDNVIYIEYIKNTWLSDETMVARMGYSI